MKKFLFLLLTFFSLSSFAQEKLIVEPDAGRAPILDAITSAHKSVDIVMYGFTDEEFANALIAMKNQHDQVRVLLQHYPYRSENENEAVINLLQTNGVTLSFADQNFKLTHQKTIITDDAKALVMTFNLTHSTFKKERNFALLLDDPAEVNEIEAVYNADWQHKYIAVTQPYLVWSPDNSREKMLALIHQAKNEILVYAEGMSDYNLVGALAEQSRNGIKVRIMTTIENGKKPGKQFNYLQKAGVQIHFSKNLVIHAKVIVIDNTAALVGSINMTKPSINENRELAVITHTPEVIAALQKTFERDWNNQPTSSYRYSRNTYQSAKSLKQIFRLAHLQHHHRHRKSWTLS